MPNLLFHSAFFNAPFFLTFALMAVLLSAALYDIKTFTIPHVFTYLVAGLFVGNAILAGMSITALSWHVLSVIIAFLIGFCLFLLRTMGGGDVKLFAALALWFFPLGLIGLIFCITTTGVAIGLGVAVYRMFVIPANGTQPLRLVDRYQAVRKVRIPYGPAIAVGTILYLIFSNNIAI